MMRQPTPPDERWQWWEDAVSGLNPPRHESEVHCGFYRVRKFRWADWPSQLNPFIPCRIWVEPTEIDPETGELMEDEKWRAEMDNRMINPWGNQPLYWKPIPEPEWKFLKAMSPLLPKKPPRR